MKKLFDVGDIVVLIVDHPDNNGVLMAGDVGRIVCCDECGDYDYGIEFEKRCSNHGCSGNAEYHHGWFVYEDQIELYASDVSHISVCARSIIELI